jgi:hypothetical protein
MSSAVKSWSPSQLKAGDWVEVRSAGEILATLDDRQCLDGLPFMPEMLPYCGKRFRVFKSAHKTCDTIERWFVMRRMTSAVHLEGLRCDGGAHDGCQAGCLLFWKDAWLKRVPNGDGVDSTRSGSSSASAVGAALSPGIQKLHDATREPPNGEGPEKYRCQATDLVRATTVLPPWDPRPYLADLTSGNVGFFDFVWYGLRAGFNIVARRLIGRPFPNVCGLAGEKTPTGALDLKVGEFVRVRSKDEIMKTLNTQQRNRGLFFDVEMTPFCENGSYRVQTRVEKIIDEKTGKMIKMPNSCLILDGVTCSGMLSQHRMFCPRSIYPYWREIWLERAGSE